MIVVWALPFCFVVLPPLAANDNARIFHICKQE